MRINDVLKSEVKRKRTATRMPNLAAIMEKEGCDHSLPYPLGIALERFGWSFDGSRVEHVAPFSRLFDHCSMDSGIKKLIAEVGCDVAGGGLAEERVALGLRLIEPKQRRPGCVSVRARYAEEFRAGALGACDRLEARPGYREKAKSNLGSHKVEEERER
jgi:hypothetical protein